MENERSIQISEAISRLSKRWTNIGLKPPAFSVKEIARERGINPSTVTSAVKNGSVFVSNTDGAQLKAYLQEPNGQRVNGKSLNEIASRNASIKRAVRQADYRSRAPGGGPIVKRRVLGSSVEKKLVALGMERLKVVLEPMNKESINQQRKDKIKKRLASRWALRDSKNLCVTEKNERVELNTEKFMQSIQARSVVSPERPKRIRELLSGQDTPLLFNWVCPPGTPLTYDPETEKLFRLYSQIDPEGGFKNDYRLYPRLNLEKDLVGLLNRFDMPLMYIKSVADNNPYCLYPACLRIDGPEKTATCIKKYTQFVQKQLDAQIGPVGSIWVMKRLKPLLQKFAGNVIRQYAVEGYFLYEAFGDNVILAWNESTRRSSIIDSLRKARGIPPLPKIYVLHEKRDGKIIDNF